MLRGRAPANRELGIATLAEVLEAFPGVVLNLDIKRTAPDVAPYEEALAHELAEHGRERRRHRRLVLGRGDARPSPSLRPPSGSPPVRPRRPSSTAGSRPETASTRTSGVTWLCNLRRASGHSPS